MRRFRRGRRRRDQSIGADLRCLQPLATSTGLRQEQGKDTNDDTLATAGTGVNNGVICHRLALQLNLDGFNAACGCSAPAALRHLLASSGLRKHAHLTALTNTARSESIFLEGKRLQPVAGVTPTIALAR